MRNQTTIRTLIREMLNELDRFSKEKGRDYDALKDRGIDFEKMVGEEIASGLPRYYFNMSNDFILSAGKGVNVKVAPMAVANPNAQYNTTPMGYYGYPFTTEFIELFKKQKLPYMQGSTLLTIVEVIDPAGVMFLKDSEKIKAYEKMKKQAMKVQSTTKKIKMPNAFAKSLLNKKQPITWVYDPGGGIIHKSEPNQVVFLTSEAFKVVDKFDAKSVFESLTGGGTQYKGRNGPTESELKIINTLKHTTDPAVVAKLAKHPHEEIRKLAVLHPLAPKELFNNEIDKIFSRLKELIVPNGFKLENFAGVAFQFSEILHKHPNFNGMGIYERLVQLVNDIPTELKFNSNILRGVDVIIGSLSKSKDDSLIIRMMEDLTKEESTVTSSKQAHATFAGDTGITKIAKQNFDNKKILLKYFELMANKPISIYTLDFHFEILARQIDDMIRLKAAKTIVTTEATIDYSKIKILYSFFEDMATKILPTDTEKYEMLIDLLTFMKSGKSNVAGLRYIGEEILKRLNGDKK
jgi:hypothetical protein